MKHSRLIFTGILCFVLTMALYAAPVNAESLQELKQQLNVLQKKVSELEAKQAASEQKAPGDQSQYVVQGKKKGSFRLPDIKTDITIGGYAKVDVVYSDKSAGAGSAADQFFVPGAVPIGDHETGNDEIVIHARQSRLFIKSETETDFGVFKAHVEGDFFGAGGNQTVSNSYGFRLRHAYGQLGGLLAGQSWSTYMDVMALPETLDFGGPAATIFVRQAQLRWTQPFKIGSFQMAVENPETTLLADGKIKPDNETYPHTKR